MSVFNFKKKEEAPIQKKGDTVNTETKYNSKGVMPNLVIRNGGIEESIEIVKGEETITILKYELIVRRDHSPAGLRYRVIGSAGSLVVTEEELDYVYDKFKAFNKA